MSPERKTAAMLAGVGALMLSLAGIWLVVDRLIKGRLLK